MAHTNSVPLVPVNTSPCTGESTVKVAVVLLAFALIIVIAVLAPAGTAVLARLDGATFGRRIRFLSPVFLLRFPCLRWPPRRNSRATGLPASPPTSRNAPPNEPAGRHEKIEVGLILSGPVRLSTPTSCRIRRQGRDPSVGRAHGGGNAFAEMATAVRGHKKVCTSEPSELRLETQASTTPTGQKTGRRVYVTRVQITDLKGFSGQRRVDMTLSARGGWTVLAGRNSSGKSTLLQALALALGGRRGQGAGDRLH
ncbi:AAA family ATPase [Streptomyces sp. NPDC127077]|uniref:AAA family ATPase n=1 Tax=Streptomyces sp. NPDC127077 TaxID=3347131 RepID=UPI003658A3D6